MAEIGNADESDSTSRHVSEDDYSEEDSVDSELGDGMLDPRDVYGDTTPWRESSNYDDPYPFETAAQIEAQIETVAQIEAQIETAEQALVEAESRAERELVLLELPAHRCRPRGRQEAALHSCLCSVEHILYCTGTTEVHLNTYFNSFLSILTYCMRPWTLSSMYSYVLCTFMYFRTGTHVQTTFTKYRTRA